MNPEEAKVPNVERDWQSIEIYLFSNGQQYSPPRKYLLRIDQLNLWDATLNHLAQSHYGLQSPLINLYTTSGHLVKGPLDLRDGQAYVAVAPPDKFVDAGYQKYLIKASRSWEKRQARKKPPECVPNEPCCLCSERGRSCCDINACCLCPEKEDADSVELLLPATGHPESRSAGGHYMSSAPAKPITADDYEPVSGNIGHMTCKHCGKKASPGEYGYSPVLVPDNQNGHEAGLSDKRATLAEDGARTDENVARPSEYGSRPGTNLTRSNEYGARQTEHETRPVINGVRPGGFGPGSPQYGTRQGEYEIRPNINKTRPDELDARPAEYETRHGENKTRPSINGAKRDEFEASPGEFGSRPAEYETKPSANGAKLGGNGTSLGEYETRPGEYGGRPSEYKTRSSINGARRDEFEASPGEFGSRPAEYETKPSANGAKLGGNGTSLGEYETRPGEYGGRPSEYKTRPSINGARRDEFEASPGEFGSRPAEYETKPSASGAKLGGNGTSLGEYETRPDEYDGRPSEYKTRSSLNGTRPGEYENKTNANGAKPVEYGARQGKYDIRQNVNGARPVEFGAEPAGYGTKAIEYETIPSLNGIRQTQYETRPGEYKARLDGYEPKPIVNGAQPGEYGARLKNYETNTTVNGSKPSRFEARTGENGARLDEYETRPSEYGARLAEYDTTPSKNTTKLGEYETRQGESDTNPDEYVTKQSVDGAKPGEYRGEPDKYGNKPSGMTTGEYKAKPGEYATLSTEQENNPERHGPSPAKNGAWTGEDGDRTTGHKARPGFSGPRLSKIEPIKEAYEIALRKNEKSFVESEDRLEKDVVDKDASIKYPIRLAGEKEKKGEYRTRDGDQKDKEIEFKDRSSGNGRSGGERRISGGEKNIRENDTVTRVDESKARKIVNMRRLSGRGGADTDQGRKSGELNKDFEHEGKANTQKGKETSIAGRAGGNGTRMSDQRNRQNDNLARLGGRESRVGDHEARAGDVGFPTNDHDTGLGLPNSREAEPVTRASVSGARAIPKDKINSRAKPGYLAQPKIGTPGTKAEEALVKLDDSTNKNRESNPVPRQSRVGGTGAAGTLHISEAQQHGRRISLSAGRTSIEKKRLPVGQNSSLLKKPTPNSLILRKLEDKQPLKINKENLPKKINEPASTIPVPAPNESRKSKTMPKSQTITPLPLPQSTISDTNVASLTTTKAILEKCVDEKEIIVSTHSFKDPESETRSMKLDSVKRIISVIENTMEETQTEMIYTEKSIAYVSIDEAVQTNTETVEQREQEVSASSKDKVNSCTCTLCKYDKAYFESDENTLSTLNKGGVVNIKVNIEVRNIVKSVFSCQKNCGRSRSLTNITRSEKESQISIDNEVVVNHNSLQSLFTKPNFRGFGFEGSPNVMVVQCAGCGKPNPPRCEQPPPCSDNSKKYFVLLNSVLEDKEDGCNFNPPCRPCDQRQSKKQSNAIPIKQAFSETNLDTITTVTVSGVPLQRREIGKCMTNTSCQTEEPQNESMMANRKVSITQDSVTCDTEKKGNPSICVVTQAVNLVPKQSCLKMCSQKCEQQYSQASSNTCPSTPPPICEKIRSVCSHVPPPPCEKDRPVCSQVPPPTCQKKQLVCSHVPPAPCEREQTVCSHVPPPVCEKVRSICSHVPPAICQKIQSVCSHEPPPVCEKEQSVSSQVPPPICQKVQSVCSHVPQATCQKVQPDCSHVPLPKCEKVRSVCSQVSSQTCLQVQSKGCQPTNQPQECMPMPPCCPKTPPPCIQVQAQAYLQVPQVCNAETQTRWASIFLQARLHCDGRYSFHLPPLYLLKNNYSCCQ